MRFIAAVYLTLIMSGSFAVRGQGGDAKVSIEGLGWLTGCWEMSARNGSLVISEHWMKPAGGSMIGMSRTVSGGKTASWEFIRIVADGGGLRYIAKPNTNKDETVFKMARSSAAEVIFENPAHDFPQRIIYRNGGTDSLFARIEGTRNGKASGMDIPMKKAKC